MRPVRLVQQLLSMSIVALSTIACSAAKPHLVRHDETTVRSNVPFGHRAVSGFGEAKFGSDGNGGMTVMIRDDDGGWLAPVPLTDDLKDRYAAILRREPVVGEHIRWATSSKS